MDSEAVCALLTLQMGALFLVLFAEVRHVLSDGQWRPAARLHERPDVHWPLLGPSMALAGGTFGAAVTGAVCAGSCCTGFLLHLRCHFFEPCLRPLKRCPPEVLPPTCKFAEEVLKFLTRSDV